MDGKKLSGTGVVLTVAAAAVIVALACALFSNIARQEAEWATDPAPDRVVIQAPHAVAPAPTAKATTTAAPAPSYIRADLPLSEEEQAQLHAAADEFGVPYELALAVVWRETNFRNVTGDNGRSLGFMQIQPRWWSDLSAELGVYDLMDPAGNFRVGCAILGSHLDRFGDVHKALMAYNCGSSGAAKLWASGVTSTSYSRAVVEYAAAL